MITIKINGVAYRAVKSSQLLTNCKAIFGAVLQAAYIVDELRLESSYNSKKESTAYLKRVNTRVTETPVFDFNSDELILQFEGGNHVLFSASEWASFRKVEVEVESK